MDELLEEEVLEQDTTPTEEEVYDAEYDKAWSDEESTQTETEEALEQPKAEDEATDEIVEEEAIEDSTTTEEDLPVEESEEEITKDTEFAETLKWKGKEIQVTREELIALGQKGFDSEKKWQDVAAIRPYHDLIKDNGLTVEQVKTLVDVVKNKNPEALALLAEQSNIDMFEAEKKDYTPKVETRNYELDDVISEINENEEIASEMNSYVESVPNSVRDTLTSQPAILRGLNKDMQQGIAQRVMPEVIKQLAINPNQDFVSLYQSIGEKVFSKDVKPEAPSKVAKVATKDDKRRVAVNKTTPAPEKSVTNDYDASWDDNEHFEAVRRRLAGF